MIQLTRFLTYFSGCAVIAVLCGAAISPVAASNVYIDDCQHWIEISTATVALHTKGDETLEEVLSYIDQYLNNSRIPTARKQQLLSRIRQVWEEGLRFGHDLEHHLMDKCDVD